MLKVFMMKYMAIMDRKPGNRVIIMPRFIRGFLAGKRIRLMT